MVSNGAAAAVAALLCWAFTAFLQMLHVKLFAVMGTPSDTKIAIPV